MLPLPCGWLLPPPLFGSEMLHVTETPSIRFLPRASACFRKVRATLPLVRIDAIRRRSCCELPLRVSSSLIHTKEEHKASVRYKCRMGHDGTADRVYVTRPMHKVGMAAVFRLAGASPLSNCLTGQRGSEKAVVCPSGCREVWRSHAGRSHQE